MIRNHQAPTHITPEEFKRKNILFMSFVPYWSFLSRVIRRMSLPTLFFLVVPGMLAQSGLSTEALDKAAKVRRPPVRFFHASDGTSLAYYKFQPSKTAKATLLFYHGAGAHSLAGYEQLAHRLAGEHQITVYLTDIRGHGLSTGPRGDAPEIDRVWADTRELITWIRSRTRGRPLFLGGHSMGAGLTLNYSSWEERVAPDGYVLLSPYLGYRSKTDRPRAPNQRPFASARTAVLIVASITRGFLFGNTPAVLFNYAKAVLERDPLMISFITANMSLAVTPTDPMKQFTQIDKPTALIIGGKDEIFDPGAVLAFAKRIRPRSMARLLPDSKHLSILLHAAPVIAAFMTR